MPELLGKDKTGVVWLIDHMESASLSKFIEFGSWPEGKRTHIYDAPAYALVTTEEEKSIKLNDIRIQEYYENREVGSMMINYIEEWARKHRFRYIYGDLGMVDIEHMEKLKHFCYRNGWTYKLFSEPGKNVSADSGKIGCVEKNLTDT